MNYAEMTENELMRAFYLCDSEAFNEIVRRRAPRLYRYFRSRGWQSEAAEDLARETLARVFVTKPTEGGRYDPDCPFPPGFSESLTTGARIGVSGRFASRTPSPLLRTSRRRPRKRPTSKEIATLMTVSKP
jgi:hypothetical protein